MFQQIKDNGLEHWLTGLGAEWEYRDSFPVEDLEKRWRKENKGRDGEPIIEALVEKYALAAIDGAVFPPIIITKVPFGHAILDGKQRVAAAIDCEATTIAAYVIVKPSPLLADKIQCGANARHGEKPSEGYLLATAKDLMERHGLTVKEAAQTMSIPPQKLQKRIDKDVSIAILEDNKIDIGNANGILSELRVVHDNPSLLCKAFLVAEKAKLNPSERKQFLADICKNEGLGGKIQAIRSWEERPEMKGRIALAEGGSRLAPIDNLFRMLEAAKNFIKENPVEPRNVAEAKRLEDYGNFFSGRLKKSALVH